MSDHHGEIFVIKKKVMHGGGHHGGAWKIAFADFMTAMMAFFLVLWIINATDKDTKTVIARYFNPVKLENPARATKGVHGETSQPTQSDQNTGDSAPGAPPAPPAKDNKDAKASKSAAESAQSPPPSKKDDKVGAGPTRPDPPVPVDVKPTVSETALFSDPYQSLERIASGRAALSPAAAPDTGSADPTREAGALTVDAFRDPFKPIGPGEVNDSVTFEAATKPQLSIRIQISSLRKRTNQVRGRSPPTIRPTSRLGTIRLTPPERCRRSCNKSLARSPNRHRARRLR